MSLTPMVRIDDTLIDGPGNMRLYALNGLDDHKIDLAEEYGVPFGEIITVPLTADQINTYNVENGVGNIVASTGVYAFPYTPEVDDLLASKGYQEDSDLSVALANFERFVDPQIQNQWEVAFQSKNLEDIENLL